MKHMTLHIAMVNNRASSPVIVENVTLVGRVAPNRLSEIPRGGHSEPLSGYGFI